MSKKDVIICVVGFVLVTMNLFACSHTSTVFVEQRVWVYELEVTYDELTSTIECGPDYEGGIVCQPDTVTTTYVRCRDERTGSVLPPVSPDLPCEMMSGDYLVDQVSYHVSYRESESDEIKWSQFAPEIWNDLEPKTLVRITETAWGYITAVKRVEK